MYFYPAILGTLIQKCSKKEKKDIQKIQGANLFLIFDIAVRGGISGTKGTRYILSDEHRKSFSIVSNKLDGLDMIELFFQKKFDDTVLTKKN